MWCRLLLLTALVSSVVAVNMPGPSYPLSNVNYEYVKGFDVSRPNGAGLIEIDRYAPSLSGVGNFEVELLNPVNYTALNVKFRLTDQLYGNSVTLVNRDLTGTSLWLDESILHEPFQTGWSSNYKCGPHFLHMDYMGNNDQVDSVAVIPVLCPCNQNGDGIKLYVVLSPTQTVIDEYTQLGSLFDEFQISPNGMDLVATVSYAPRFFTVFAVPPFDKEYLEKRGNQLTPDSAILRQYAFDHEIYSPTDMKPFLHENWTTDGILGNQRWCGMTTFVVTVEAYGTQSFPSENPTYTFERELKCMEDKFHPSMEKISFGGPEALIRQNNEFNQPSQFYKYNQWEGWYKVSPEDEDHLLRGYRKAELAKRILPEDKWPLFNSLSNFGYDDVQQPGPNGADVLPHLRDSARNEGRQMAFETKVVNNNLPPIIYDSLKAVAYSSYVLTDSELDMQVRETAKNLVMALSSNSLRDHTEDFLKAISYQWFQSVNNFDLESKLFKVLIPVWRIYEAADHSCLWQMKYQGLRQAIGGLLSQGHFDIPGETFDPMTHQLVPLYLWFGMADMMASKEMAQFYFEDGDNTRPRDCPVPTFGNNDVRPLYYWKVEDAGDYSIAYRGIVSWDNHQIKWMKMFVNRCQFCMKTGQWYLGDIQHGFP